MNTDLAQMEIEQILLDEPNLRAIKNLHERLSVAVIWLHMSRQYYQTESSLKALICAAIMLGGKER